MVYVKSIVAGLVAVFSVAVLIVIYLSVSASKEQSVGTIGWNPHFCP